MSNKTTNTTNVTKENSNIVSLSTFGAFCKDFKSGEKALTCTVASMTEYGIADAKNLITLAQRLYIATGSMMDLRQAQGLKVDGEQLSAAEGKVKTLSDSWFKEVGTRESKKGEKTLRPCYGTRYSDFAIYGEIMAQAMALSNNDITKVDGKFFEILVLNTARILTGEKLGRVTETEFKKAKAEANKVKAEKAKETKAKNAEKASDDIEKESIVTTKIDGLEITIAAQTEILEKAINLILASHATKEEKDEIIQLLTIKPSDESAE